MGEEHCEKCGQSIEADARVVYAAKQVTTTNEYGESITLDGEHVYFHEACWVSDNNAEGWRERRRGTLRSVGGY
jgi:hypothetical protein